MEKELKNTFNFSSFHNSFKLPSNPIRGNPRKNFSSSNPRLSKTRSQKNLEKNSLYQEKNSLYLEKNCQNLTEIEPVPISLKKSQFSADPKLNPRKFSQEFYNNVLKVIPKDNSEFNDIVSGCLKLEEVVALYEKRNSKLKLRIEELEKENEFLGRKLKDAWKNSKVLKKPDVLDVEVERVQPTFVPRSQTGRYLKGLWDKFGCGSQEFFREVEAFLEFKEHKLRTSIEHYKNIIQNLQEKLKKKNSEYLDGLSIGNIGKFFKECVEDVKKFIVDRRHTSKVLISDKLRIMEKFLLNESILKMIYSQLIEDQHLEPSTQNKPIVPDLLSIELKDFPC
jgi:hypothetical protein